MKNSIFETPEAQQHFMKMMKEIFIHQLNQKRIISVEKLYQLSLNGFGLEACENSQKIVQDWYQDIVHLHYLSAFETQDLQEIIIHHESNLQVITHQAKAHHSCQLTSEDLQLSFETLAIQAQQEWSYNKPFTSFSYSLRGQLYRVTLIHSSVSLEGISKVFIRKFHAGLNYLSDLKLDPQLEDVLVKYVREKKNILITGSTGSGKTTLLKSMLNQTDKDEHLVVLEDYPELNLARENTTQLIAQEEDPRKTLKAYCAYAMRMRPDRIALGEMRGAEVTSFLLSMNTGHKGMMATLHSNSAIEAVMRMVTLFSLYSETQFLSTNQLVSLICQNIDGIVFMQDRQIKEVIELRGSEEGVPYYETLFRSAA